MQEIWQQDLQWDEPVSHDIQNCWLRIANDLVKMCSSLFLPRLELMAASVGARLALERTIPTCTRHPLAFLVEQQQAASPVCAQQSSWNKETFPRHALELLSHSCQSSRPPHERLHSYLTSILSNTTDSELLNEKRPTAPTTAIFSSDVTKTHAVKFILSVGQGGQRWLFSPWSVPRDGSFVVISIKSEELDPILCSLVTTE